VKSEEESNTLYNRDVRHTLADRNERREVYHYRSGYSDESKNRMMFSKRSLSVH
jgi:hypothetical protein